MRSYIKEILNKKLADNVAIYEILKVVNEKYFSGKFEDLDEGEKVVFLVGILDGEVNNGGFDQYFFNNGIKFADITISSLDIIGADYTAAPGMEINRTKCLFKKLERTSLLGKQWG